MYTTLVYEANGVEGNKVGKSLSPQNDLCDWSAEEEGEQEKKKKKEEAEEEDDEEEHE